MINYKSLTARHTFLRCTFKSCNFSRSEQIPGCSAIAGAELCFICCAVALSKVGHHISGYQIRTALQTTGCWNDKAAYHSLPALSLQWVEGLASPLLPKKGSGLVQQAVAGICSNSKLPFPHPFLIQPWKK